MAITLITNALLLLPFVAVSVLLGVLYTLKRRADHRRLPNGTTVSEELRFRLMYWCTLQARRPCR